MDSNRAKPDHAQAPELSPVRLLGRVIDGSKPAPFPGFVDPCCPKASKAPPSGDGWLHEIKHDGYRAQAQLHDGARIFTRRGHDWAARMPSISAAVGSLPVKSVILDGELVRSTPRATRSSTSCLRR